MKKITSCLFLLAGLYLTGCDFTSPPPVIIWNPTTMIIDQEMVLEFDQNFRERYISANDTNNYKFNAIQEIPFGTLYSANFIDSSDFRTDSTGIAIRPLLFPYNGKKYYCYAIEKGRWYNNTFTPLGIKNKPDSLVLLLPMGGHQLIKRSDINNYVVDAKASLKTKDANGNIIQLSNINKYPDLSFYFGFKLLELEWHNIPINPNATRKLVLKNGARAKAYYNAQYPIGIKVPSPVLEIYLNNASIVNSSSSPAGYACQRKALDVGKLCPPDCD